MKERKKLSIVGFFLIILFTAACIFVAWKGVGEKNQGSAANIKLGLDLAGGVSVTYEADDDNPSAEDMSDTVYKLQQRVEVYSTEAEAYQVGSNRITVEIPGVYDAEEVLSNLGNPGSISFQELVDTTKEDAITPSGTALALADSINEACDEQYEYVYDRSQVRKKRDKKELGISAVRGGTIVGEHEVIFAGIDEVIEFKHTAYSKSVFAKGAVEAGKFLKGKPAGMYDMADVIG